MIVIDTTALTFTLAASHTSTAGMMYVSSRNINPTTPTYVPKATTVLSNGTSSVTIVSVPSAGTYSLVDFLSYYNNDTGTQTITITMGSVTLNKVILGPGERLEYAEGKGWSVLMDNGATKLTYSNGSNATTSGLQIVTMGADVTNNNATANTLADVTGLSFAVTAFSSYYFRFVVKYTAAATTTGSRWTINGPGSPAQMMYNSNYSLTTTSMTFNTGLTAYDLPSSSNGSSAATSGNIAIVEGFIVPSANGAVQLRFASEISSSAIIARAGSFVEYMLIE